MSDSDNRSPVLKQGKDVGNPNHPVPYSIMKRVSECIYEYLITVHLNINDKGANTIDGKDFQFRWYNIDAGHYHEPLGFDFPIRLLDIDTDIILVFNTISSNVISSSGSNYFIVITDVQFQKSMLYNQFIIQYKSFPKKNVRIS